MEINITDGTVNIGKFITLFRGMKRNDLLSQSKKQIWKDWIKRDGEIISYKTTLKNDNKPKETLIAIIFFEKIMAI